MTALDPLLVTDPDEYRTIVWAIGEKVCERAKDRSHTLDEHARNEIDAFNGSQRRYVVEFTGIGTNEDGDITVGLFLRYRPQ